MSFRPVAPGGTCQASIPPLEFLSHSTWGTSAKFDPLPERDLAAFTEDSFRGFAEDFRATVPAFRGFRFGPLPEAEAEPAGVTGPGV